MAQIRVEVRQTVAGTPERVLAALGDYQGVRARSWPDNIHDYRVLAGGAGAGSRIAYRLQATRKRSRDVDAIVSAPQPDTLLEADQNSSLRTTYQVAPAPGGPGAGASTVTAITTWDGAGGIGGFFERTFAPIGIRRLHTAVLERIAAPAS